MVHLRALTAEVIGWPRKVKVCPWYSIYGTVSIFFYCNLTFIGHRLSSHGHLTRAPLGYSAERAPLGGGGGRLCPPCLTPELIGAARRARRRSKALNEKIPMHFKKNLKEVTCKVKVRSKVRNMCFRIIAHRDRAINSRAPKLSQNACL